LCATFGGEVYASEKLERFFSSSSIADEFMRQIQFMLILTDLNPLLGEVGVSLQRSLASRTLADHASVIPMGSVFTHDRQ